MKTAVSQIVRAIVLSAVVHSSAALIPSDRLIDWSNVGVTGGIPNRTDVYTTLSPGATDTQINAALSACPSGKVVQLSAGTFSVASTISVPSNVTLRGAGPDSTIIAYTADVVRAIMMKGGYSDMGWTAPVNIVSGYTKGSNQVALTDASGFAAGSYVYLSELNDTTIPVVITNTNGTCNYCGIYGSNGLRARFQLSNVTAVAGNTLTIDPPMFFTFSSTNSPQALKAPAYVQYAGLEDVTIRNNGTSLATMVWLQGAANCWVKNVNLVNSGSRGIDLNFDVYRNEVRECTFTNVVDQSNSNQYALQIENGTGNLIEDNIFDNTANGIILVSASGNVFGYNYMHGVHRTAGMTTWFWPDTWTHGSHSAFNLWEGNDETALEWDYYWGSNSHDIAFRNRFHGKDETVNYDVANLQTCAAVLDFPNNNYMTAMGNVLGTGGFATKYEETGYAATSRAIWATPRSAFGTTSDKGFTTMLRHMNYDYFTISIKHCGDANEPGCQGGDGSTALPASLYRSIKPAWFGAAAWPPIGPDVAGYATDIPAKIRFNARASVRQGAATFAAQGLLMKIHSSASVKIACRIPEAGRVLLAVYDAAGRHVSTLFDGQREAGDLAVTWNATKCLSGIYFVGFISGKNSLAEKVAIVNH
ncbi:MAG TPA: hypothetical protein VKF42_02665 [Chitinivibrionales bacterium]|jgi:parallel beta-helix repeat protein|nr:hypothetical protein [Chitinivibrionales bacterium]